MYEFNLLILGSLLMQVKASRLGVWQLVMDAGPMVKGVLLMLFVLSIFSWAVIGWKYFQCRRALKDSEKFLELFWSSESLDGAHQGARTFSSSPLAQVFKAGYQELGRVRERRKKLLDETDPNQALPMRKELLGKENVERAMRQAESSEINRLLQFLPFLATTGSTAPFIGLFGTVWGIMTSFQRLAVMKSAGLEVVAPGISEALIATAAGLAAAIPAVVAYNFYLSRIRYLSSEIENFRSEFLNIIDRHYLKKLSGRSGE